MSTWVSLEPQSVLVDPGGRTESELRIRNTSDIVEEYRLDVVGAPAMWCTVDPTTLRLYPGTTGTARLTFSPPRGPDPAAGPHPYGVRVRAVEAPDAVTVTEGNVSVAPFTDVRAELLPVIVRGWRRVRPKLVVDNYGNTLVTASAQAAVQDNSVDFVTRTPSFQVPPGRAFLAAFTGHPSRLLWFGRKVKHPFAVTIVPSGSATESVPGTYEQTALLPSWMSRLLMLLLMLLAAFIALWMLAKPSVASQATAQAASSSSAQPVQVSAPAQPSQPSPPVTPPGSTPAPASSSASSSAPAGGSGGGGGGGGGGAAAKKGPKPIGMWPLTSRSSGPAPTAKDTAGKHPLKGHNTTWCTHGSCALFNPSRNAAFASKGPVVATGPGKSFTVSAYVYLGALPASGASDTAVAQSGGKNKSSAFFLQYLGGKGCWAFSRETGHVLGCTRNYAKHWTYLTGVYNGKSGRAILYVNGKQKGAAVDKAPTASTGPLTVGRAEFKGKAVDWWNGGIKDVEIFNQALTSQQVQAQEKQHAR